MTKEEKLNKIYQVIEGHKEFDEKKIDYYKTIRLGDVLDFITTDAIDAEYKGQINYETEQILLLWVFLRKPIEDQPEECIDFIYSLICND